MSEEQEEEEIDPNLCKRCNRCYELREKDESTGYCDLCAQDIVEESEQDRAILDWLEKHFVPVDIGDGEVLRTLCGFSLEFMDPKDSKQSFRQFITALMEQETKQ